ncbi:hypothetical protein AB3Z07_26955 (plasmid) [Metabacillus halosaccharovorans]|uniref:hypothetical protein n=1 Tax=Metabacillus halosaccharovorans TaxID=930124 RepID=UPI00203BAB3D|nr:hypothetical protein [Metabacillus halosaccharovorans]MCM3444163.1 hypothetical protein [Metabacillus halosaccharovorans]
MSKLPNSISDTKDRPPSTPRWVKISGIIAIIIILLVVILMFIGGGNHGPGRHLPGGEQTQNHEQENNKGNDGGHKPLEVATDENVTSST